MVDLRKKPYCLTEEDIAWVRGTISSMDERDKVGQLFWQLTAGQSEEYLGELVERYRIGGCRYNPMPAEALLRQNRILQSRTRIPLFIACNPERGGDGVCTDGTYVASGIKVGATDRTDYAEAMGYVSGMQMAAVGCNTAFAPVVDILYNHECDEVLTRSFGSDPERVARMGVAYMRGVHRTEGMASVAKHFPGNGQDYRDAHLSNNVNSFGREEWHATYGAVYKALIDEGLDAVMSGHILMPEYEREVRGDIAPEQILPATLSYEIMTVLLREELGFNGVALTDATHMVGLTDRMKRSEMLPLAINAGCDMILFFNDPEEDFGTVLAAYRDGTIPEWRMTEALTRILGLKAKLGLHRRDSEHLCPSAEGLGEVFDSAELKAYAPRISRDALTLVKYLDPGVLPISPERTPRITVVPIKGATNPMMELMMASVTGGAKDAPAERLAQRLRERGFQVEIYESALDKLKRRIEKGERPSLDLYFSGKHSIADFVAERDLVISLFDVAMGHPVFGFSKGGGEIPWYVHELPVIGISVGKPTVLSDCPMLRTYINAYDATDSTLDALVEALTQGPEAFRGRDPIDSFCGMWDTRI